MGLLNNLVSAVYYLINFICILIVVRALISWLPLGEDSKIVSFLNLMTEPVVSPIRKVLYKFQFMQDFPVDFSPMIAIIILWAISSMLVLL